MGTVQQIRYNGPYSIQKYCGKGNYLLNDKCKTIENLKKWIEPDGNNNENIHDRASESDMVSVVSIHDMDVISASVGHNVTTASVYDNRATIDDCIASTGIKRASFNDDRLMDKVADSSGGGNQVLVNA